MTLKTDDKLLVGRGDASYKIEYKDVKEDILSDVPDVGGPYVELNGDGDPQVITGSGGLKTEGLLESEVGVRVSGGTAAIVENGLWFGSKGLTAGSKTHGDDCYGLSVIHAGDGDDSPIASSLRIGKGGAQKRQRTTRLQGNFY